MHPIHSHQIARSRMEDLHRDADRYRFANGRIATTGRTTRVRAAAGHLLVRLGERVAPVPVVSRSGPPLVARSPMGAT